MKKEEVLNRMDLAIRQDRERFFKVADTLHLQPKYGAHLEELEEIKQFWRDITESEGYPNIDHPTALPEWFPKIHFASSFTKDVYINDLCHPKDKRRKPKSKKMAEDTPINTEEIFSEM